MNQNAPISDDATVPENESVSDETHAAEDTPVAENAAEDSAATAETDAGESESVAISEVDAQESTAATLDPQMVRLLEAVLFAAAEPMDEATLATRLPEGTDVRALLAVVAEAYANRGVNLVQAGGKWLFRTAEDLAPMMRVYATQTRKLSRAAIETMAIVAYHQPITRAEMEEIRGVGLSKGTLDMLFEQGWITPRGRRQTPGKPVTWGTTERFLVDFGIESLEALPGVDELKAAGLLDKRPAIQITDAMAPDGDPEAEAAEEEARLDDESLLASMASDLDREPSAGTAEDEAAEAETANGEDDAEADDEDDENGEDFNGGPEEDDDEEDDDDDEDLDGDEDDDESDEDDDESEDDEDSDDEDSDDDEDSEDGEDEDDDADDASRDDEDDGDDESEDDEDDLDDDDDEDDFDDDEDEDEDEEEHPPRQ